MKTARFFVLAFALSTVLAFTGCSKDAGNLSGTIDGNRWNMSDEGYSAKDGYYKNGTAKNNTVKGYGQNST